MNVSVQPIQQQQQQQQRTLPSHVNLQPPVGGAQRQFVPQQGRVTQYPPPPFQVSLFIIVVVVTFYRETISSFHLDVDRHKGYCRRLCVVVYACVCVYVKSRVVGFLILKK